jgi:hypothetical protein
MELFTDLGLGFATAFSPFNLLYCFIGVLLGEPRRVFRRPIWLSHAAMATCSV